MLLLWHGEDPIGICVFSAPAFSLKPRSAYFGLSGKRTRLSGQGLNRQLLTLSRVVIHPKYRGAGLASRFVRRCCELSGWPWIETLAEMGNINPFFERAGFVRVGKAGDRKSSRSGHSGIYGNPKSLLSQESHRKSRFATPIYYVFDNRMGQQSALKLNE